jgi:hypothetical protein
MVSTGATIGRTDDSKDWAICTSHKNAVLDPGGEHCTSYNTSYKPRYVLHTQHYRI